MSAMSAEAATAIHRSPVFSPLFRTFSRRAKNASNKVLSIESPFFA